MASEFELIRRYFTRPARRAVLGVGDDCALIGLAPGCELAISTDMLVAGTHFFPATDVRRLGHKTLAVNLSDLAAMGATPRHALLSLALPAADEAWMAAFAAGFFALAERYGVELIGGDTTRAPAGAALALNVTILGEVPAGHAVLRSGAAAGDDIWVSGTLGDAALGLVALKGAAELAPADRDFCVGRLEMPTPRVELGLQLRGIARAMLDVSDGLAGDLAHLARASSLAARVDVDALPLSAALKVQPRELALRCALAGGDDYELCFCAAPASRAAVAAAGVATGVAVTRIGTMAAARAGAAPVAYVDAAGQELDFRFGGYDHFGAA
jgi:thiamine-monophosphate kinase